MLALEADIWDTLHITHYTLHTAHYTWYTTHYTVKYWRHDTVVTLTPSQGDTVTVWLKYRKIHSWVTVPTKYRTYRKIHS